MTQNMRLEQCYPRTLTSESTERAAEIRPQLLACCYI